MLLREKYPTWIEFHVNSYQVESKKCSSFCNTHKFDLSNKITWVKDMEGLWFQLIVNKTNASCLLCFTFLFFSKCNQDPSHYHNQCVVWVPKHSSMNILQIRSVWPLCLVADFTICFFITLVSLWGKSGLIQVYPGVFCFSGKSTEDKHTIWNIWNKPKQIDLYLPTDVRNHVQAFPKQKGLGYKTCIWKAQVTS